jgi:hypothetical protein
VYWKADGKKGWQTAVVMGKEQVTGPVLQFVDDGKYSDKFQTMV